MQTKEFEIPVEYYEIQKIVDDYKEIICHKFRNNQAKLVHELQQKAKKLKQSIAFYKKQTSNQNIEKLITKKRHQKQAERLALEVQWRNLTEKQKKLKEQQKKINEENRQNKFDLQNLQTKIQQVKKENERLSRKVQILRQQVQVNGDFITQTKVSEYSSPYKSGNLTQCKSFERNLKELKNGPPRIKISSHTKYSKNSLKSTKKNSHDILTIKQSNIKIKNQNLKEPRQCILPNFRFPEKRIGNQQNGKVSFEKCSKWNELTQFLGREDVRDKIFEVLRK